MRVLEIPGQITQGYNLVTLVQSLDRRVAKTIHPEETSTCVVKGKRTYLYYSLATQIQKLRYRLSVCQDLLPRVVRIFTDYLVKVAHTNDLHDPPILQSSFSNLASPFGNLEW